MKNIRMLIVYTPEHGQLRAQMVNFKLHIYLFKKVTFVILSVG
jgi:hypothetical protein